MARAEDPLADQDVEWWDDPTGPMCRHGYHPDACTVCSAEYTNIRDPLLAGLGSDEAIRDAYVSLLESTDRLLGLLRMPSRPSRWTRVHARIALAQIVFKLDGAGE